MPGKAVRLPTELLERYDRFAEQENEARARAGLVPISGLDLLRVVASCFAGLPMAHDVDLAALRSREKLPADMWTPPHPPVGKARAKKTPPHGGKANMTTPPHGGHTTTKRAKKSSTANMTTPPNPPIGKARRTTKKGSTS